MPRFLLRAHHRHRVDAHRPERRHDAARDRHQQAEEGRGGEGRRVGRLDAGEEGLHSAAGGVGEEEAGDHPRGGGEDAAAEDGGQDVGRAGS